MPFANIADAKFAASIINEGLTRLGQGGHIPTEGDDVTISTIENAMRRIGMMSPDVVNPLLNQIEIVLIYRNYATMFTSSKNPTRVFWRDAINYGGGIEDIYHNILEPVEGVVGIWAQDYADGDPTGEKALSNAKYHFGYHPEIVSKKFHTNKRHFDIALSLSEHEISKVFTPEGFMNFVSVKMANIQYSAEIQLQKAVINNVVSMVENNDILFRSNFNVNRMSGITDFVEDVKTVTDGMKQPTNSFNKSGILTMSDNEDLYLVTVPHLMNRLATRGAENAFNLREYEFKNKVLYLPEGTDLGTAPNGQQIYAVLVDKRAIVMAMRFWSMKPFIPTGSDFQNYFFKCEYVEGYNEFFNAVAFTGESYDDFFTEEGGTLIVKTTVGSEIFDHFVTDGVREFEYNGFGHGDPVGVVYSNATYVEFLEGYSTSFKVTVNNITMQGAGNVTITPNSKIYLSKGDTILLE